MFCVFHNSQFPNFKNVYNILQCFKNIFRSCMPQERLQIMNFPRLSTFKPFFTVHRKYIHINLDLVSSQFSFLTFYRKFLKYLFQVLYATGRWQIMNSPRQSVDPRTWSANGRTNSWTVGTTRNVCFLCNPGPYLLYL